MPDLSLVPSLSRGPRHFGVVLTKNYTQNNTTNWSYPNIHGDILFTADATATRTGTIHLYDPYGQNIDPATGEFADIPIPATAEGGMDFGYLGQHTVPVEHLASQQALEMGARTYLPILGRFLQVDPILGGSANNYDYVNGDPINTLDLTGKSPAALALGAGAGLGPVGVGLMVGGAAVLGGIWVINKITEDDPEPSKTPTPGQSSTESTTKVHPKFAGEGADAPPSKGSTGRTTTDDKYVQAAMDWIKEHPDRGQELTAVKMSDTQHGWVEEEGWVKMEYAEGGYVIHCVHNKDTGVYDDFKYVDHE
ncbi:RHS repeat-associated core domain-containing protein [Nocardia transvalensis]|uniref:RHS repeat-associated core domain-containing protein n=1 Tax=Nocardia transvalensis TaxID=37333 RepID=UPI00189348B6|nr:RHS repeat-associated core domain-containing protein [Nocardia transvalensis]MBF6327881.1 hypothetical protein [Nocardia transvalensis]